MESHLKKYPELAARASSLSKDAASLVPLLKTLPNDSTKANIVQSYVDSLKIIWIVMMGFAIVAAIASLVVKGFSLDRYPTGEEEASPVVQSSTEEENFDSRNVMNEPKEAASAPRVQAES